jgi:hypothetical protein
VGGRIPTLVFREIFRLRHPKKRLSTAFIASGKTYIPSKRGHDEDLYEELHQYLKKITRNSKKILLITQFIHRGSTVTNLLNALRDAGAENIDVAAVEVAFEDEARGRMKDALKDGTLFTGGYGHSALHNEHEHLSGVRKGSMNQDRYCPYPRTVTDVISVEGRDISQEEWREFFDIKDGEPYREWKEKSNDPQKIAEFDKWSHAPVTKEEKTKIQEDIHFAREDVKLLARRVVENVWGKESIPSDI